MVGRYKALILAAGLGTRLRPLTDKKPKPLIPFAGSTPLELAVANLTGFGVVDIAINTHYFSQAVIESVDSLRTRYPDARLHISHEPEILGTGGALNPLRSWLGAADLIIVNGDVVSTADLKALVAAHSSLNAAASMMLLPKVLPGESAVFHRDGRILGISKTEKRLDADSGNFACAQIVSRSFVDSLPSVGAFDIISKGYLPTIAANGTVACAIHDGYWHDLGTPKSYLKGLMNIFDHQSTFSKLNEHRNMVANPMKLDWARKTLEHPSAKVSPRAHIGPHVVIESDVSVAESARISESVLLPGAQIHEGQSIHRMIIGPDMCIDINLA